MSRRRKRDPRQGIDTDWLEVIEARVNAATPGPWRQSAEGSGALAINPEGETVLQYNNKRMQLWHNDLMFVLHAREDVGKLISEIRRLRKG